MLCWDNTDSNKTNEEKVILHPVLISLVKSKGLFSLSEEPSLFPTAVSNSEIEKKTGYADRPFLFLFSGSNLKKV